MNYLNEMPILIAERVRIMIGPEELLKVDKEINLRLIVLDAAGNVAGVLLDRIRNHNKAYFDQLDTKTSRELLADMLKRIFEKALDESTISQAVNILKEEQKLLRQQASIERYETLQN